MLDLMIAGVETTSTALTWGTLFMIKYPDIQRRVQNEIFTQVHTLRSVNNGAAGDMPDTRRVGYPTSFWQKRPNQWYFQP